MIHNAVQITIPKPAHGAVCNSCGACCMAQVCPLGSVIFRGENGPPLAPCPALEAQGDGRHVCGLVANPRRYMPVRAAIVGDADLSDAVAYLIGARGYSTGCDCHAEGEPYNEAFVEGLDRRHREAGASDQWSAALRTVFGIEPRSKSA